MQVVVEEHSGSFSTEGKWAGTVENCMIPVVDIDTGTNHPRAEGPRKLGQYKRKAALERIQELLEADLIQLSTSEWAAAVVIVVKSGKMRLAIDYRQLNSVTRRDMNRLPPMKEVLAALGGSVVFSVVDISNYFHQFPLTEQASGKTAFLAPDGLLYQWLGMPFGLVNAPAVASRTAALILSGLNWLHCLVYIDDIIIHSRNEIEHIGHVAQVLNRVGKAGLKLKLEKCEFGVSEVKYLGYMASSTGLRKDPEKVKAVRDWPRPKYGKEMHTFLAFCGFYRCFIRRFSDRAEPLMIYTRANMKEREVDWTESVVKAFIDLKNAMCDEVALAYPDYGEGAGRFVVRTDASFGQVGAILGQYDRQGRLRPIEYASKTLTEQERSYHITEKEGLAAVWALNKWKGYLEGMEFILETDHSALLALQTKKDPHGRLERWMTLIQQFNITIKHVPGKLMVDADALSRQTAEVGEASLVPTEELEFVSWISDCGPAPEVMERSFAELVGLPRLHLVRAVSEESEVQSAESEVKKVESEVQIVKGESLSEKSEVKKKAKMKVVEVREKGVASVYAVQVRSKAERKARMRKEMEEKTEKKSTEDVFLAPVDRSVLIREQQNDTGLVGEVYSFMVAEQEKRLEESKKLGKLAQTYVSVCELINDLLFVVKDPFGLHGSQRRRILIFVPDGLKLEILKRSHLTYQAGHPQVKRLYSEVSSVYYWRGMYADCERVVRECEVCQRMRGYGKRREGGLQVMTANEPNEQVGIDLMVLPKSQTGNKYILTIVCYFSKYTRAVPISSKNMESVAYAFYTNWLLPYGAPDRIISDQGNEFVNGLFEQVTRLAGVEHKVTTPYHPQANGQVESTNKLITSVLKFLINRAQNNWDQVLALVETAINTREHPATLETPFFLWHLREYKLQDRVVYNTPIPIYVDASQFVCDKMSEIDSLYERVRLNILMDKGERKEYYDKVYGNVGGLRFGFRVGDKVWLYTPRSVQKEGVEGLVKVKSKLAAVWEGPFRVVRLVGEGPPYSDYCIQFTAGQKLKQVVNINRLKPYYGEESEDEEGAGEFVPEVGKDDTFDIDQENFIINRVRYWNQPVYKDRPDEDGMLDRDEYEIERIVDVRRKGRGKNKVIQFRVSWKGFGEKQNSWIESSEVNAKEVLDEFRREKRLANEKVDF